MTHLLILGGTTEANALAKTVAERGIPATYSYAGRVDNPRPQPLPVRVGGFGGVAGLAAYLRDHTVTHVIDATHPFAAQMSANAVAACQQIGVPLAALTRPAWVEQDGDRWHHVPDIDGAVAALSGAPQLVFLAVGRMHLDDFAAQPQHRYLLRLVDEPGDLPLPHCDVVVSRGPFTLADDQALMQRHEIQLVVSKNAGGLGARAKLDAARALGLPVLMIDRPALPQRVELSSVAQVLDWLAHSGVNLGV
ncbi:MULTISPECIES: cobalt-precorrin-6A reductase [unclassified Ruegeria]|uniref:cobalt-precorrin-6A reductase n=1 Tax=unclassified Ruegeria TaxID=2625375 RepID=UPI001ADBE2E8|nr:MULTISPECIES: cobalt-precorrin-6A reductase [unclassified Ruegeria]MBO9410228.1 cobalt-precorrin-6A reductase [Ruegeria sp. R8_1]MBO9414553.1 cobalt-precorrin-6A reductase [Ruegeria sp. R8_2]